MNQTSLDDTFVCGCHGDQRSACEGLPFYGVHEGRKYCVLHLPSEVKEAAFHRVLQQKIECQDFNLRGVWFPSLRSCFKGFSFDSEVDFSGATFGKYANFRSASFQYGANFSRVVFLKRRADFYEARFDKEVKYVDAEFRGGANFYGATFEEADFSKAVSLQTVSFAKATFERDAKFFRTVFSRGANFSAAAFCKKAEFTEARFSEKQDHLGEARFIDTAFGGPAGFWDTTFGGDADFYKATFKEEVEFIRASFNGAANFRAAIFVSDAKFIGNDQGRVFNPFIQSNSFRNAQVEMPERISFQTVALRPNWFIGVDARGFNFTDVNWHGSFTEELEATRSQVSFPHSLLAKTYRELAINAENNHRYPEAGTFSYQAMDTQRKEKWHGFAPWRLDFWYWALSGYSERQLRAGSWLLVILFLFAGIYTWLGFPGDRCEGILACGHTLVTQTIPHSLGAMTLQSPAPRPDPGILQLVVFSEGVWGPLQLALFALALRRRFMR